MLCLLLAMLMMMTVLAACSKDEETSDRSHGKGHSSSTDDTDEPLEEPSPSDKQDDKDDKDDKKDDKDKNTATSGHQLLSDETGYGYIATYQPMDLGIDISYAWNLQYADNGRVTMRVNTFDEETGYYGDEYVSMLPDGTDVQVERLPEFNENEYVQNICWLDDGFWIVTYEWVSNYDIDAGIATPADLVIAAGEAVAVAVDAPVATVEIVDEPTTTDEPADDSSDDDWMSSTEGDDWTGSGDDDADDSTSEDDPWIDFEDDDDVIDEPVEPGYYDSYEIYRLYRADKEGNILAQPDITELVESMEYFYINSMFTTPDGSLFLLCETMLYQLDADGNKVGELQFDMWIDSASVLPDGRVLVTYYGENGREMNWLNTDTMELGEAFTLDESSTYYNFYFGGGSYDMYLDDRNVLYGFDTETNEMTPLLNWMDSDVNIYNMNGFCVLSEEEIMFLYQNNNGSMEIGSLKRVPASEIPVREIITVGGNYLYYDMRSRIADFNRTNTEYRITFVDYSKYATDENYMASYERLNMDMASGVGPDILLMDGNININNYVSKGFLTDLYTFMGEGAQWQKEDLVEGYRNAQEIGGGLYSLTGSFNINGMWTNAEYVGDDGQLSLDELIAACQALPAEGEIMPYMTKMDVLRMLIAASHSALIDAETGECHFDTPEFAKLLEYANLFPEEIDWENYDYNYTNTFDRIRAKELIFTEFYMYSFSDLNWTLMDMRGIDGLALVGYPSVDNGTFVLQTNDGLAINSNSQYQDVCWEIVSYYLTDEYQDYNSWQLSVRQDRLEQQAKDSMQKPYYYDENGEKVEYENTYWDSETGEEKPMPPLTQEQVDFFMDAVNRVDGSYYYDEELMTVVNEEVGAYFAGQKPAEEVARLIQSRVQIYVNEQR